MNTETTTEQTKRERLMAAIREAIGFVRHPNYEWFGSEQERVDAFQVLVLAFFAMEKDENLDDLPVILFFDPRQEFDRVTRASFLWQGPDSSCVHFFATPIHVMQARINEAQREPGEKGEPLPTVLQYPLALKMMHEAFTNPPEETDSDSVFASLMQSATAGEPA